MSWGGRGSCAPSLDEALACLRAGRVGVRKAVDELAALGHADGDDLVVEAREQLLAAMHLIDGAGVALGRNGR